MKYQCECIENMKWVKSWKNIFIRGGNCSYFAVTQNDWPIGKNNKTYTLPCTSIINIYDNNNIDWSYEHALLYCYVEYEMIELIWTQQLDLPQLLWQFFNNDECDFKVTIVVGM